ncbi:hypothetical protein V6N12_075198 [Hibiscus sabdariffa]|uniref:Uncharacterized protein n=1 Tax=Hibiscus sabdariffa TaxID=183260 RepID=A0ABR2BZT4_9ROSI
MGKGLSSAFTSVCGCHNSPTSIILGSFERRQPVYEIFLLLLVCCSTFLVPASSDSIRLRFGVSSRISTYYIHNIEISLFL